MFKPAFVAKTSQLLIFLLLITAMMPVFAFAAVGFKDVTYDGNTVTGDVYYDASQGGRVNVAVYTPDNVFLGEIPADFTVTDGTYHYYHFDRNVTATVYRYLDLKDSVTNSVYQAVYDITAPEWPSGAGLTASDITRSSLRLNWPSATDNKGGTVTYHVYQGGTLLGTVTDNVYNVTGLSAKTDYSFKVEASDELGNISTNGPDVSVTTRGSSGGGGGGGVYNPGTPSSGSTIDAINGTVSADALKKAFEEYTQVQIKFTGNTLTLPVSALIEAAEKDGATLTITNENGSYILPLSALNLESLALALNTDAADITLRVEISKITGGQADAIADAAKAIGGKVASAAVDFKLALEAKDGRTVAINSFDIYVKRVLPLTDSVDSSKATVVRYDDGTNPFSFVPATFGEKDGSWSATAMSKTNSVYLVLEFDKSFADVNGHWAEKYIELLANKLVVDGVTDTTFEPERNITRAEFAALVVRSLGLPQDGAAANFADVSSGAWYAGVVGAAAKAGIVDGYEDGTFRPDAMITREELAAMVVRAMNYAGKKVELSSSEQSQLLSKFKDAKNIIWGHKELAIAIDAKIIDGMTDDTLGPRLKATRAQSAAMLQRLLANVEFID